MKTPEKIDPAEIARVKARCQKCRVSILFTDQQWRIHGSVSPCLCGGRLEEDKPMETQEQHFMEPKSWCFCGHLGDGPTETGDPMWRGQHGGFNGHGPCMVEGCDCDQFTWKRFTNRFNEWRARREE